jgi:hypothetical protein
MKQQADKRRTDPQFAVRDLVFIKLQPYVQSSVARHASLQLSSILGLSRWHASSIQRPTTLLFRLIQRYTQSFMFHSYAEHWYRVRPLPQHFQSLLMFSPFRSRSSPCAGTKASTGRREQVQVQWSHADDHDITWEDMLDLQQRFSAAPAWGQADSQGGGDVSDPDYTNPTTEDSRPMGRPRRLMQPNRKHVGP